ncbi:MAG: hypothetical protein KCHDKBKB_01047 [Elusimicrobia bacterium]|nr:hypothetical protein [Elusimicrobiota bacterium]
MTAVASFLSVPVVVTVTFAYTNSTLVSEATGGEVSPGEVRQAWIYESMEEIDRRTGMCFRPKNFMEDVDGNDLIRIFAPCFPVLDISQVVVDGDVLSPSAYVVNKRTGSVTLRDGAFPSGIRNVTLSGIYGRNEVPPLIEKIATLIVAKTALSSKNGPLVDSESLGDFSQSRSFKKLNDELDRAWESWGQRFPVDFAP